MNLVLVLNRHGQQLIQKISLDRNNTITIGRGWQNEVIINDEYVDGVHARLALNELNEVTIEDLSSANGTYIENKKIGQVARLVSGASVAVGDTTIVIHDTGAPVVPALKRNGARLFSNRFNSFGGVIAATVLVSLALLLSIFTMTGVASTGERILSTFLATGAFLLIWTLIATFVSKLFRNETNGLLHWTFISAVAAVTMLTTFIVDMVKFNLDSGLASLVIDNVLKCSLIAVVGYVMFSLSTRLSNSKKLVLVSLLAVLPVVHSLVKPKLVEKHQAWSNWAQIETLSHPPAFLLREPTTLKAHLRATDALFAEVDNEVQSEDTAHAQSKDQSTDQNTDKNAGLSQSERH